MSYETDLIMHFLSVRFFSIIYLINDLEVHTIDSELSLG